MTRRQTARPERWLIVDDARAEQAARRLPPGSGILLLGHRRVSPRLRLLARALRLSLAFEGRGSAARVHNPSELRRALLDRSPLILLSPIFPTRTHPRWAPIARMRAAALARLGGRRLIALGGMTDARFQRVRSLGFQGWAGISAFRT